MYLVAVENYEHLVDMEEESVYLTIRTILENITHWKVGPWILQK